MQRLKRSKLAYSAILTVLLLADAAQAQEKPAAKPPGSPVEALTQSMRDALDESIHENLRGIIDHGAILYNQGDWNGCYRLWEGALMTLKPLVGDRQIRAWTKMAKLDNAVYAEILKNLQSQLGERPKLKEVIETSLTVAKQTPTLYRRAFILRVALDQIRAETKPANATAAKQPKPNGAPAKQKTLWDRLGGEPGVTKIVDDFVNLAAPDPKVDFFRGGKSKMTAEQVAKMKRELVEQISEASGGPLKYKGPDMKTIHKGMGITDAQFNAAAADLKKALEMNHIAAEDEAKVLDAVGGLRKEIVEPKKKEEQKPAGAASVQGRITFQGKPLTGGTIEFTSENGGAGCTITRQGTYKVERLKPGDYTIKITGGEGDGVPAKYGDSKTSGLKISVRDDKQNHDIVLE